MPWPLWVAPSELATTRTVPIVLPFLQVHAAQTTIRYPAGYRLITGEPVQQSNALGAVSLTMKETPSAVVAVLRVDVNKLFLPAEAYGDLKDLLAWIQDACGRTFILEKER
jgi:hypothetical protein